MADDVLQVVETTSTCWTPAGEQNVAELLFIPPFLLLKVNLGLLVLTVEVVVGADREEGQGGKGRSGNPSNGGLSLPVVE